MMFLLRFHVNFYTILNTRQQFQWLLLLWLFALSSRSAVTGKTAADDCTLLRNKQHCAPLCVNPPQCLLQLQHSVSSSKQCCTIAVSEELSTYRRVRSMFRIHHSNVCPDPRLQSRFRIGHHFLYLTSRHCY